MMSHKLDKMDAAASKVRRCQALVTMLEVAAPQVSLESVMEVVGLLKDTLAEAGTDIEDAYEVRQRPSLATDTNTTVASLVPNRRPAHKPGS